MIEVNHVSKSFGSFQAVNDVTLNIERGKIHGLLGSNGAGKTTLLKVLAGIYKADTGQVIFNGEDIFENEYYKQQMIFISDIPFFFKNMSLNEMAAFYKGIYHRFSDARLEQLARVFKMDRRKKINRMSKGMQRQCAFILALSARPNLMLLDEPFDGLDPIARHTIKNLLFQDVSNHEMALFVSSHNLREMEDFCDTVSIMHEGKLLLARNLDDLKSNVCKVQVAFKTLPNQQFYQELNVVEHHVKGRVVTCIVKGDLDNIEQKITNYHPLMYDILPLTLEEIFTYELGGHGYAIENIVVE